MSEPQIKQIKGLHRLRKGRKKSVRAIHELPKVKQVKLFQRADHDKRIKKIIRIKNSSEGPCAHLNK